MKRFLIAGGILLLGASGAGWYAWQNASSHAKSSSARQVKIVPEQPRASSAHVVSFPQMSLPVRLVIPAFGIDVAIEQVGRLPNGEMATPASLTTVGWFKEGPFPGNPGRSVLAGHTGRPNEPTVFRQFEKFRAGDAVRVIDERGTRAEFVVLETATYTPEQAPREKIFGASATERLALITCVGAWLPTRQTYSHRLVVYMVRSA